MFDLPIVSASFYYKNDIESGHGASLDKERFDTHLGEGVFETFISEITNFKYEGTNFIEDLEFLVDFINKGNITDKAQLEFCKMVQWGVENGFIEQSEYNGTQYLRSNATFPL